MLTTRRFVDLYLMPKDTPSRIYLLLYITYLIHTF